METLNSLFKTNMVDDILNQYCSQDAVSVYNLHQSMFPNDIFQNTINKSFEIKDVIFNDPATIVFWTDGSKTVVKCKGKDAFDPEKGLAMAIVKKVFGNQGNYYNQIKKWL